MKKFYMMALLALAMAVFIFTPTLAEALCGQYGYVARVSTQPGTSYSYIYLRTGGVVNYYYQFSTNDSKLIDAALNAVVTRARVYIRGNASSCPTTGTGRYGGVVDYFAVSP